MSKPLKQLLKKVECHTGQKSAKKVSRIILMDPKLEHRLLSENQNSSLYSTHLG